MIKIETHPTNNPRTGLSKWWGEPDMPDDIDFPGLTIIDIDGCSYKDTLSFICQIRCEEIALFDTENLLPHNGMLYFFAALDYFLGDIETPIYPGLGLWESRFFRVLYSDSCDNLHTHQIIYEDGSPAHFPAESITLSSCNYTNEGIRLLGKPYIDDVQQVYPNMISLLQIDESERWGLRFHDCGMLNFLISPESLRNRQWDKVMCHLFSF